MSTRLKDSSAFLIFSGVGLAPARRSASTSTLAAAKPSSMAGVASSPLRRAASISSSSLTSGEAIERSNGNTWLTTTPRAWLPSALMKPDAALFDSVTICALEPAARMAFMPSTTCVPEPTKITACALACTIFGATGPKSGLEREYFSCSTGLSLAPSNPIKAPAAPSSPKASSACSSAMRSMPISCRWRTARSASRW